MVSQPSSGPGDEWTVERLVAETGVAWIVGDDRTEVTVEHADGASRWSVIGRSTDGSLYLVHDERRTPGGIVSRRLVVDASELQRRLAIVEATFVAAAARDAEREAARYRRVRRICIAGTAATALALAALFALPPGERATKPAEPEKRKLTPAAEPTFAPALHKKAPAIMIKGEAVVLDCAPALARQLDGLGVRIAEDGMIWIPHPGAESGQTAYYIASADGKTTRLAVRMDRGKFLITSLGVRDDQDGKTYFLSEMTLDADGTFWDFRQDSGPEPFAVD